MPKVTITIEGEMSELAQLLGKMGELGGAKQIVIKGGESEWTDERVLKVWRDLSENCKAVLSEIAKKDDMTWEQLIEKTGRTANEIGGSLSSLGANLRNHGFKGITHPLAGNEKGGYNLLPVWKEIILKQI